MKLTEHTDPGPADYDPYSRCDSFEGPHRLSKNLNCRSPIQRTNKYEKMNHKTMSWFTLSEKVKKKVDKNDRLAYRSKKKPLPTHAKSKIVAN
jgi:hypothetical protein